MIELGSARHLVERLQKQLDEQDEKRHTELISLITNIPSSVTGELLKEDGMLARIADTEVAIETK